MRNPRDELDTAPYVLGVLSLIATIAGITMAVDAFVREEIPLEARRAAQVVPLSLSPAGQRALAPGGEHPAVPLEPAPRVLECPPVLPR